MQDATSCELVILKTCLSRYVYISDLYWWGTHAEARTSPKVPDMMDLYRDVCTHVSLIDVWWFHLIIVLDHYNSSWFHFELNVSYIRWFCIWSWLYLRWDHIRWWSLIIHSFNNLCSFIYVMIFNRTFIIITIHYVFDAFIWRWFAFEGEFTWWW